MWTEISYFLDPGFRFRFTPDTDYLAKLSINVDITVAMPCDRKEFDLFLHNFHFLYTFERPGPGSAQSLGAI